MLVFVWAMLRVRQVVHFLWEILPLADFSTDFLAANQDVSILVPECALCATILETLWSPYVCSYAFFCAWCSSPGDRRDFVSEANSAPPTPTP